MKLVKLVVPAVVVTLGLLVNTAPTSAKPEFSKKEKKACTFCHIKMGAKELNDAGKYYKEHNNSLEGYKK